MGLAGSLLLPALLCGWGCGCDKKPAAPANRAGEPGSPSSLLPSSTFPSTTSASTSMSSAAWSASMDAAAGDAGAFSGPTRGVSDEVFSAPIAAVRVHGVDVVAGLVAAEGVIRVVEFQAGRAAWSVDALRGVKWAPDAELHVKAAGDGYALVWSGLRDGKSGRSLVEIGARGEPKGATPAEIGASYCTTREGIAWIGRRTGGPTGVRTRHWSDAAAHDALAVPKDRDPSLVCGDHAVVVLGDGSDDLTASWFAPGDAAAGPATVVLRDGEFSDDEREHEAFIVGDALGVVRVGVSGAVAVRTVTREGVRGAWQKLRHALSEDDEIVAVDGDPRATLLVLTHEVEGACAGIGSTPERVQAIRVDRSSGEEAVLDLAPVDCQRGAPGPFWLADAPLGAAVTWVEHRATRSKAAPIDGLAFRVVRADGVRAGRVEQTADALVEGGCDEGGCSAAALVRAPGSDGMRPAPIRILSYP
jgi:hypothetical protein